MFLYSICYSLWFYVYDISATTFDRYLSLVLIVIRSGWKAFNPPLTNVIVRGVRSVCLNYTWCFAVWGRHIFVNACPTRPGDIRSRRHDIFTGILILRSRSIAGTSGTLRREGRPSWEDTTVSNAFLPVSPSYAVIECSIVDNQRVAWKGELNRRYGW